MGWAWMGPAHACRSLALSHPGRLLQWPVNSRHSCVRGFICMWAHRWPRRTSCYMATAAARPAAKFWQIRSGQAPQCPRPGRSSSPRRCERLQPWAELRSQSRRPKRLLPFACRSECPPERSGRSCPRNHRPPPPLSRSRSAPSCQALLEHRHLHRPGLLFLGDRAAFIRRTTRWPEASRSPTPMQGPWATHFWQVLFLWPFATVLRRESGMREAYSNRSSACSRSCQFSKASPGPEVR